MHKVFLGFSDDSGHPFPDRKSKMHKVFLGFPLIPGRHADVSETLSFLVEQNGFWSANTGFGQIWCVEKPVLVLTLLLKLEFLTQWLSCWKKTRTKRNLGPTKKLYMNRS